MAILEAWACRKPVVMTPECNLPEGFTCGAALRIETNPESIARGLDELWGMTAAERAAVGERGYELTATRFVWSRVAEETKRLYEWMLGAGPPPPCIADL